MPELPEVTTVKNILESRFTHKIFKDVIINYDKILDNISPNEFRNSLINQEIISFSRKGKYLIFNLSNGYLISHLRMEGKYKFDIETIDKHSHIIFKFQDGDLLIYHDVRKFGRMYYFSKDINIYNVYPLNKIGKEPFEIKDINDFENIFKKISKDKRTIKEILLDQSILAGIGNIYADEILFKSKILPTKNGLNLTFNDVKLIIDNACIILNAAILNGGSTVKSFESSNGVSGHFQENLMVYGKENKPCPICNNLIKRIKIKGRSTHFCAYCQK